MINKEILTTFCGIIILIVMNLLWFTNPKMEAVIGVSVALASLIKFLSRFSPLYKSNTNNETLERNIEIIDIENLTEKELNNYYGQLFLSKGKTDLINLKSNIDQIHNIKDNLISSTKNTKFRDFYFKLIFSISNATIILIFVCNIFGLILNPQLTPSHETLSARLRRLKLKPCLA